MNFKRRMQIKAARSYHRHLRRPFWVDISSIGSSAVGCQFHGIKSGGVCELHIDRAALKVAMTIDKEQQKDFIVIAGDGVKWLVRDGVVCHYDVPEAV